MAEDKQYYINGAWVSWIELHRRGYTKTKPDVTNLYTVTAELFPIIRDKDTDSLDYNKYYDKTSQSWVDDLSTIGLFKLIGDITFYQGELPVVYTGYSSIATSDEVDSVYFENEIVPFAVIYDKLGITKNKSNNFSITNGVIQVWYDPVLQMYWDDREDKKLWSDIAPEIETIKQPDDVYIKPSPEKLELWPQWEYDLSQIPITYRSYSHSSQEELLNTQSPLLSGLQQVTQWDLATNLTNELLYPDSLKTNISVYVANEAGATGYDGTHYDQGDAFLGDYKEVWVESDVDVDFYLGTTHFVYGQTHDEVTDEIYWCDNSEYKTYDSLHAAGYTKTRSQMVEIFDPFMLDRVAWPDEMWLYFNTNTRIPMTIPVIDGTVQPARFDSDNTDPYNSSVLSHVSAIAKQPGLEGNRLAVDYYWMDGATYYVYRDGVTVETLRGYSPDSQYVIFDGMPNMGRYFAGRSPLSGGADISTLGIPIYYSNGIQARTVDFIGQKITGNLKVMQTKRANDYTIVYPISDLQAEANDFSFVDVDGLLYLRYSGPEPILGACGISFTFDYTGSLDTSTLIEAYFTSLGDLEPTEDVRQNSVTYTMYDRFGNLIPYDSTKTYTTINMLLKDGIKATYGDFGYYETYSDSVLKGRTNGNKTIYKLIIKVS